MMKIRDWFLIKDTIYVTVDIQNGNMFVMPYDEWQRIKKSGDKARNRRWQHDNT